MRANTLQSLNSSFNPKPAVEVKITIFTSQDKKTRDPTKAARCGSKNGRGVPCQYPEMANGRCRLQAHGIANSRETFMSRVGICSICLSN